MSTRDELADELEGDLCRDECYSGAAADAPFSPERAADFLIAEGWRKVLDDLTVERVDRGGDFQSITFSNGSTIYGSSEQDAAGNWIDSRAIEAILALMDRGH